MIARLKGLIWEKMPPNIVILDVGGVGYEIEVPVSTFSMLPKAGESTTLEIQNIVREDASLLYGFYTQAEKEAFRLLIKVSGIGPKSAIVILSGLSVSELYEVISSEDVARLTRVPGIGKKTAERLIVELKDKIKGLSLGVDLFNGQTPMADPTTDAVLALATLGYKQSDAEKMIKKIAQPAMAVDELIKLALQSSMKK
ncbi:Holliday junction ATP-dependent DNA helicase RuvA [Wohlfahrtiimonas chitiniclastica SH04]|uniref:Holliday junction branch migration complex subunit RuvA n=1 Tax=Wohlfahrtiimonas chitiniclastica SH04 TaxID=1261130 RepID=L8XTG0_9GAMM|nr:Holliday junction branch migration protein RuvA [Wohlfahrtiimonas chitiniclastica]ELV07318.1 Holliday junction ATP-dependent DNA helicase RuvA [Wohlfahrtiimonas chitiniclastica SH04]KZX36772.1 Holliday junction DNA helicase RuvA [Wohlfahrtiimonas chitiniclastica]